MDKPSQYIKSESKTFSANGNTLCMLHETLQRPTGLLFICNPFLRELIFIIGFGGGKQISLSITFGK